MAKKNLISKEMSVDELKTKVAELKQQLFRSNLQKSTGQLEKTAVLKTTRREIARALTFITMKSQG